MKIKHFILPLLLFPLLSHAKGPDRACHTLHPDPKPAPKRFPIPQHFKKEYQLDQGRLRGARNLQKKKVYKKAHSHLALPETGYNTLPLLNTLPYGLTSLDVTPEGGPEKTLPLTKAALEKLRKYHPSLEHLRLFGFLPNVEKALRRLPIKSLILPVKNRVPWLPDTLESLSLQGEKLSQAGRFKAVLSRLSRLQSLELSFQKGFAFKGKSKPALKENLDLAWEEEFGFFSLLAFVRAPRVFPTVTSLTLRFRESFKPAHVRDLPGIFPHLASLTLDFAGGFARLSPSLIHAFPKLKTLKIRDQNLLNFENVEEILTCALPQSLSPERSLEVSLDFPMCFLPLKRIAGYLKETGPRLKELCLRAAPSEPSLESKFFKMEPSQRPHLVLEKDCPSFQEISRILSHVESLSLLACDNLLCLFQGVEKLDPKKISLRTLTLHAAPSQKPEKREEISGFFSLLGLQSLKALDLKGPSFFSPLFEASAPYFNQTGPLFFTSLKLNILDGTTALCYPKSFGEFLKVILHKAPLTSFSLTNADTSSLAMIEDFSKARILETFESAPRYEEVVFNPFLPLYTHLENFELAGLFTKVTLQKLFDNEILLKPTLKRLHLNNLAFAHKGKYIHPRNLMEFLGHFMSEDITVQAKEQALTEYEVRKILNIHKDLEISFETYSTSF